MPNPSRAREAGSGTSAEVSVKPMVWSSGPPGAVGTLMLSPEIASPSEEAKPSLVKLLDGSLFKEPWKVPYTSARAGGQHRRGTSQRQRDRQDRSGGTAERRADR
jgi:hypothetical protein